MPGEVVPKIHKLQTIKGPEGQYQNLELGLVLYWKPVQLMQKWMDVFPVRGPSKDPLGCILDQLEFLGQLQG